MDKFLLQSKGHRPFGAVALLTIYKSIFRCVHASLYEGLSVRGSVGLSVHGPSVARFFRIVEIDKKQHRIIGKVETLFLDCNNLHKILKQNFKTKF